MAMNDEELLARMNSRVSPTMALMGMRIEAIDSEAGRVRLTFTARPEHCNPMGNVQGGFIVAMLDEAASISAIAKSGRRIVVPTIELKTSFFGPAKAGAPLYAEGRCVKFGKRVAFMEADLLDSEGKLLARQTTSAMPVDMPETVNLVERA